MSELSLKEKDSYYLSGVLHFIVAAGVLLTIYADRFKSQTIEMEIIENPSVSPQATKIATIEKKAEEKKIERRAVFGVSRKALTSETGEVQAKAGNTIAKTPDQEKLNPNDEDALPIPTDEYLVSEMPQLISEVRIPYPNEAKKNQIQGAVVMDILIDASGKVREAKLVEGPGYGLNEAALSAISGFKFKPARVADGNVAVRIRYAYRFILEK